MLIINICLGLVLICSVSLSLWFNFKYRKTLKHFKSFDVLSKEIDKYEARMNTLAAEAMEVEFSLKQKIERQKELETAILIADSKREAAEQLVEKDYEVEKARRRSEFEQNLEKELNSLKENSPKAALEAELQQINEEIAKCRQTLIVQQEQQKAMAQEEDFVNYHSIQLDNNDIKDIELIRQFAPQLHKSEVFRKLIWSEFYQKPLQQLCKILDSEKVRGIYKITNIKNQRMYIGQSVDIQTRWKDHVKAGLGIGSNAYMTNKFYKALYEEGPENFTFEILEKIPEGSLGEREFYWIDFYNATSFGYNSQIGG